MEYVFFVILAVQELVLIQTPAKRALTVLPKLYLVAGSYRRQRVCCCSYRFITDTQGGKFSNVRSQLRRSL